jgi:hypothetical protein
MTLFALGDGTTSLYISNGGGVLGGHAHESVRQANAAFIHTANELWHQLKPDSSYPMPELGQTVFYALTDSGVLTGGGSEQELGIGQHELSVLSHAGHGVLTQLRLLTESSQENT